MASEQQARSVVLQFYRRLYAGDTGSAFLCRGNGVFMHPVLTPNFFLQGRPEANEIATDRLRFRSEFGQERHWVQLFSDQIDDRTLAASGYLQTMACTFNVFTRPRQLRPLPGFGLVIYDSLPMGLRQEYEQKTALNCHNLPPDTLRRIEQVLNAAADQVRVGTALRTDGSLAGAVTIVRAGRYTLFVNAWVDGPERGRGVMSSLYAQVLQREFADGQQAAFYWTFNPLIAAKGNLIERVQVFEYQPDRLRLRRDGDQRRRYAAAF